MKKLAGMSLFIFLLPLVIMGQTAGQRKDWGTEFTKGHIRFNYWSADYGTVANIVKEESGVLIGEEVDFDKDLNIDTPSPAYELELWAKLSKRNRTIFSFSSYQYQGDATLTREIEFAGETFPVSADVSTDMLFYHGALYHNFLVFSNKRGGVGPLVGIEYYYMELKMNSSSTPEKVDEVLNIPVPVIGLAGDYNIGYGVGVWGKLGWVGLGIEDVEVEYMDWEIGLSYKYKRLFTGLSYRSINSFLEAGEKGEDGYIKFDSEQTGVVASIGINF